MKHIYTMKGPLPPMPPGDYTTQLTGVTVAHDGMLIDLDTPEPARFVVSGHEAHKGHGKPVWFGYHELYEWFAVEYEDGVMLLLPNFY